MKHGGSLRRLALALERPLRRNIPWLRFAGLLAVAVVVGRTGLFTILLVRGAEAPHPWAGDGRAVNFVDGVAVPGDPLVPLDRQKIPAANPLMLETSLSSLLSFTGLRATLVRLWSGSV